MHHYPTIEELGDYALPFMHMTSFYLTTQVMFGDSQWFRFMERQCIRESTDLDLIIDVRQFVELFWAVMHGWNFQLSRELTRASFGLLF